MEFCGAGSLDSFYRTLKNPISEDALCAILYDSLRGLEYLHTKAALIHRDIKAGNLLLTDEGQVKLADFGVSAQLEEPSGHASTFIGTPYWMAPEVIMTEDKDCFYTTQADIWSVGITAIELAEKNPPLSDIHPMRALKLIPTTDIGLAKPKNFSRQFVDFVEKCLTRDPAQRPTATQLLAHPFIERGKELDRQKILQELINEFKISKAKKKGINSAPVEDEEEDDKKAMEEKAKVVQEAVKYATKARIGKSGGIPSDLDSTISTSSSSGFGLFVVINLTI